MIENFGKNVMRLRKEKGISQEDLANEIGVGKAAISKIEVGTSYPTFANLEKIAKYFNATPNELFGTSQDIELEKAVYKTDEYDERAKAILTSIKKIDHYFEKEDFSETLNKLMYLTTNQPIFNERGEDLHWKIDEYGNVIKGRSYTFEELQNEGGNFIAAYEKETPLEKIVKANIL